MDSPPPRATTARAPTLEDYELDSDDDLDEDYVLGNLDASDWDDDDDDEDDDDVVEGDDDDGAHARRRRDDDDDDDDGIEREDMDDSDVSDAPSDSDDDFADLEDEVDFSEWLDADVARQSRLNSTTSPGRAEALFNDAFDVSAEMFMGLSTSHSGGGGGRRGRGGGGDTSWLSSPATAAARAADFMFDESDDDDDATLANAVARRTRAKVNLAEADVDAIGLNEQLFGVDEQEFAFLDEETEYQNFLKSLSSALHHGGEVDVGGTSVLPRRDDDDDDDDDDDYAEEDPEAAAFEWRVREERRAARRAGGLSAPASELRRSARPLSAIGGGNYHHQPLVRRPLVKRKRGGRKGLGKQSATATLVTTRLADFTVEQVTRLNQQIHQHTQLLFQSFCMTATDKGAIPTARVVFSLITAMQRAGSDNYELKRRVNAAPYGARFFQPTPETASWYKAPESHNVLTVFDCAPLRQSFDFVTAINDLGYIDPPEVWYSPREAFKAANTPTGRKRLARQPPSSTHVRRDTLFREIEPSHRLRSYRTLDAVNADEKYDERWKPIPKAVADVARAFLERVRPNPALILCADVSDHRKRLASVWLKSEDELLAIGIKHYANDWPKIAKTLCVAYSCADVARHVRLRLGKVKDIENNCIRKTYEHVFRALDENEISTIEREIANIKSKDGHFAYVECVWTRVCAKLTNRHPRAAHKLWRELMTNELDNDANLAINPVLMREIMPRYKRARQKRIEYEKARAKRRENIARKDIAREDIADSDTDDDVHGDARRNVAREQLPDSDSDDNREREHMVDSDDDDDDDGDGAATARAAIRAPPKPPPARLAGAAREWTIDQDRAIIDAAAFGEPFDPLVALGAPCHGRSLDAVAIRYDQLKASRRRPPSFAPARAVPSRP